MIDQADQKDKNYIIDVDLIISRYNDKIANQHQKENIKRAEQLNCDVSEFKENPPEELLLDRYKLAKMANVDYQVLSKYAKGKVPKKTLEMFLMFEKLSGLSISKLVKEIP